ncbi:macro domain-containing protein [Amycolatopsis sp. NPDC059657]|uniref:macro domain-containing protein n=1 Tax=Amycolatopsis sp. NPDC059657 TaxID=3346899 RepID=UPI00366DC29B
MITTIALSAYREAIELDEPFVPAGPPAGPERLPELAETALQLLSPHTDPGNWPGVRQALRAVLTVREPGRLDPSLNAALDALLGGERLRRQAFDARTLPTIAQRFPGTAYPAAERTVLWRGDLTTLAADAIVNAANSALLGCFRPMHGCVDNAIHEVAGPRLRADCQRIMTMQGAPEVTGEAKITRGYHLPARYVLHTVGPIVEGPVELWHEEALESSYRSCLDVAAEVGDIRTVAFCGVSTGVFGFPRARAAEIALETVAGWLGAHPGRFDRVIFTTFGAEDDAAYRELL